MGFSLQGTSWRSVSIVLLGLILIILLLQSHPKAPFHICYSSRDRAEASPSQQKTFNQVLTFEDMSHENDATFAAMVMPKKQGFIWVKHNETFSIGRGISMFHAMHCVSLIRGILQVEIDYPLESSQTHHWHGSNTGRESSEHFRKSHMPHCLSYIAQSILCAGDSIIEQPWLEEDTAGNIIAQGVHGHGIEHQCKNTDILWSVARQSENMPIDAWNLKPGDTVESVFGSP